MLTFAGHVQVQREKNHCPREAWDTKLCKKNQKTKNQKTNQSIDPSINQTEVSISLQARQLRNGMIALKEISL